MNIFKSIKRMDNKKVKIDLAFHYHKKTTNALVFFNLGRSSIKNVSIQIINTHKTTFTTNIEQVSQKTGLLIKLEGLSNNQGLPFDGDIDQVFIKIYGEMHRFTCENDKFIKV